MVDNAQNDTQHQFTGLCKRIGRNRAKKCSKMSKFEQKRFKNRDKFGLKKISDGESKNFSGFRQLNYT